MYLFSEVLDCPRDYLFRRKQRHHCQGFRVSGKTLNQIVSIQMRSTLFCDFVFLCKKLFCGYYLWLHLHFVFVFWTQVGQTEVEKAQKKKIHQSWQSHQRKVKVYKMKIIMMIIKKVFKFYKSWQPHQRKVKVFKFYNLSSAACSKFKTSEGVVKVQAGVRLIKLSTTHLINTALALYHQ